MDQTNYLPRSTVTIPVRESLRELRLWHWKKVISHSKAIERYQQDLKVCHSLANFYHENQIKLNQKKHIEHMKFVQTLNNFFPVGDTAEKDASK